MRTSKKSQSNDWQFVGGLGRNLIEAVEASTHALFPSRENGGVQAGVQVPKNNESGPWFDSNMPITVSAVDVARS